MRSFHVLGLLVAPVLLTASAFAATPKPDVTASVPQHVSTGISAPVLLDPASLQIPADVLGEVPANNAKVVLSMNVDEKGNAQNIKIVKSAGPELDSHVVAAVMQSHFRPAQLNNHAIPVDMALTVNVLR